MVLKPLASQIEINGRRCRYNKNPPIIEIGRAYGQPSPRQIQYAEEIIQTTGISPRYSLLASSKNRIIHRRIYTPSYDYCKKYPERKRAKKNKREP